MTGETQSPQNVEKIPASAPPTQNKYANSAIKTPMSVGMPVSGCTDQRHNFTESGSC